MARIQWPVLLVAMVALGTTQLSAGESRGRGTVPMTIEQINERLGADNALSEEQQKKVKEVNEEFTKKMDEAKKKPGAAEAQEAVDKARQAQDRDAMRAAFQKLAEAMGFNPREEYKKALTPVLKEEQLAKLFPARGGEKKAEEKK